MSEFRRKTDNKCPLVTTTVCQTSRPVSDVRPDPLPTTFRPATRADLARIAALHARRLPGGFFVKLGPLYMRAYHRTFLESGHAVALVAESASGGLVGFVVGPSDAQLHRQDVLRRHGARLALAGAFSLLLRPSVAAQFLRTRFVRYLRAIKRDVRQVPAQPASGFSDGVVAVLAHIAVDEDAAGGGVGRSLVSAFVEAVSAAGADRVELVTRADEQGAAGFYERLGWRRAGMSGSSFERFVLDLR